MMQPKPKPNGGVQQPLNTGPVVAPPVANPMMPSPLMNQTPKATPPVDKNKSAAPKQATPSSPVSPPQVVQGSKAVKPAIANEPTPIKATELPVPATQTPEISHKPPVTPQGPMPVPNIGNPPKMMAPQVGQGLLNRIKPRMPRPRFGAYSAQVTPGRWNQR